MTEAKKIKTSQKDWLKTTTKATRKKLVAEIKHGAAVKPFVPPPVDSGYYSTFGFVKFQKLLHTDIMALKKMNATQKKLYNLVLHWTELQPIFAEERKWAGISVNDLADAIGISPKQVSRYAEKNPFRSVVKSLQNRNRKLVRIAHPSDLTPEDFARIMKSDWEEKTERKHTNKEFGELVGIAKDSPVGLAPDIFRTTIANWSGFMAGVEVAIADGQISGDAFDGNPDNFVKKFFHYPSISVMRRFWHVAREHYHLKTQANLNGCPILCDQILKVLNEYEIQVSSWSGDTKKGT